MRNALQRKNLQEPQVRIELTTARLTPRWRVRDTAVFAGKKAAKHKNTAPKSARNPTERSDRTTTAVRLLAVLLAVSACGAPTDPQHVETRIDTVVILHSPRWGLDIGESRRLQAVVQGEGSLDPRVRWAVDHGSVAVSGQGDILGRFATDSHVANVCAISIADPRREGCARVAVYNWPVR